MKHLKRPSHSSNQILLLDQNALIVESCDSLFSTQKLKEQPVVQWLPFMESIYDSLLQLNIGTSEVLFSKVEEPHALLPGFYDFTFIPINIGGEKYILWTIYDFTFVYQEIKKHQQVHNELEIKRQRLELKIQLLLKKNIELYEGVIYNTTENQIKLLLKANSTHLTNILEDYIEILQKPDLPSVLQKNIFSVKELLTEIQKNISSNYTKSFTYHNNDTLPESLLGDVFLLKQLLYNTLIDLADLNVDLVISATKENKSVSNKGNCSVSFEIKTNISDISTILLSNALLESDKESFNKLPKKYESLFSNLQLNLFLIRVYGDAMKIESTEDGKLLIRFVITYKELV